MKKTALIFGITGQAGSYLAELLLEKGYTVHGVIRRSSSFNTKRLMHIYQDPHASDLRMILHYGDVTDAAGVSGIIKKVMPDEIYNLAAQSHVHVSFKQPTYTADATATGVINILEAIRLLGITDKVRFLQASSSEMFGKVQETPQKETTPFYPRSPYGVSKLFGYWATVNYREAYGLFACNSICFNMESPRRGETFVTRKITRGIAAMVAGKEDAGCIYLGNLEAKRDWGHAKDYVHGMYSMLQNEHPDDFVIATGKTNSVRSFLEMAFEHIGVEIGFSGSGENEIATVVKNRQYRNNLPPGKVVMKIDPIYYRPAEVDMLLGDASKARSVLDWEPKYTLKDIIAEMMEHDFKEAGGQP